jgi:hypothetical protein
MLLRVSYVNVNKRDRDGCTALIWAARDGRKEIVQILEEKMKKPYEKEVEDNEE